MTTTRKTKAKPGDETVSQNGYTYVKVIDSEGKHKWRLKHHIIVEEKLGRPLRSSEQAYFIDGNRRNFTPTNIGVRAKGASNNRRRLAAVEAQLVELTAERQELLTALANPNGQGGVND